MAAIEFNITKPDPWTVQVQAGTDTFEARFNAEKKSFELTVGEKTLAAGDWVANTEMPDENQRRFKTLTQFTVIKDNTLHYFQQENNYRYNPGLAEHIPGGIIEYMGRLYSVDSTGEWDSDLNYYVNIQLTALNLTHVKAARA